MSITRLMRTGEKRYASFPRVAQVSIMSLRLEGLPHLKIRSELSSMKVFLALLDMDALPNVCIFRGVYVGSKEQMEDMVQAIEMNDIHPVVDDEVFDFEKAREAYQYQVSYLP